MYIWYFWQGNHQIYGHIRCVYTVLANPTHNQAVHQRLFLCTCMCVCVGAAASEMQGSTSATGKSDATTAAAAAVSSAAATVESAAQAASPAAQVCACMPVCLCGWIVHACQCVCACALCMHASVFVCVHACMCGRVDLILYRTFGGCDSGVHIVLVFVITSSLMCVMDGD